MAVVASFTWEIVSGGFSDLPFTVQFTNTSQGETSADSPPDFFMWDFGDGFGSDEESPSHEYTSAGPFTVTFVVIEKDGSEINTTFTNDSGDLKTGDQFLDHQDAYDDFNEKDFVHRTSGFPGAHYSVKKLNNNKFEYSAAKITQTYDLTSFSPSTHIAYIQEQFASSAPWVVKGNINFQLNGSNGPISTPINDNPNYNFVKNVSSVIGTSPTTFIIDADNYQILTEPVIINKPVGWVISARIYTQAFNAKDETSQEIGPPTIDFDVSASSGKIKSLTRVSGGNIVSATFRNLTENLPIGATFSYKKRKAGTLDAFTEISTDENTSSINFDIFNP